MPEEGDSRRFGADKNFQPTAPAKPVCPQPRRLPPAELNRGHNASTEELLALEDPLVGLRVLRRDADSN
jgi:hypothetical protein